MISSLTPAERAAFVRQQIPPNGLFAGQEWRTSPDAFLISRELLKELEFLGRVLLQFYRAVNLLYRRSASGEQPGWVAETLDRGKPPELIDLQRSHAFRNEVPRVIRPDILLTDDGIKITELDSVPGGIGLTAWLNQAYSSLPGDHGAKREIVGGAHGMVTGFGGIFGEAKQVYIVVSEEAATYRPEMEWIAGQLSGSAAMEDGKWKMENGSRAGLPERFQVQGGAFEKFAAGDAIYRFFEMFDVANVPAARRAFAMANAGEVSLTPAPKPVLEEKMLLALLWNRNLEGFWRQNLGSAFFNRMVKDVPYTWLVDPTPLPPHAAIPELNITDWQQLKGLSHRERELILKVSGFSDKAWGARGVFLGSDLSHEDWSAAVDKAIESFAISPFILQRYHKPRGVDVQYYDFDTQAVVPMHGRVRLCPYYFVVGKGDAARTQLGGILATICPADKKIIHGMKEAILAPCAVEEER